MNDCQDCKYFEEGLIQWKGHPIYDSVHQFDGLCWRFPEPVPAIRKCGEFKLIIDKRPIQSLEPNFTVRASNALRLAGIHTIEDLCNNTRMSMFKYRYIGRKSLMELDDFLDKHGLKWANE